MLEKDERVQKLEKWCQGIIDTFRNGHEKLDDMEKKQTFIGNQFLSPCQIEIFWVSEPSVYQLFVFLHDFDRPDKEIKINGPFKGSELEKEVIKIMDESRWKKMIPYQADVDSLWNVDVGAQLDKYSDAFVIHFLNFLNMIRNDSLINFKNGLISGHGMLSHGWIATFKGNAAELGYFETEVAKSLEYAKQRAASIQNGYVSEILQPQPIKDDKPLARVIGAYYYPGVFIGDNVELNFKEKLYGPNIIEYPKYEFDFTFNGRKGFCDKYGFVVVQIEDEKSAIKTLNTIFGVSLILGIESLSVHESELIISGIESGNSVLGNSLGGCSWHQSNKRFKPMNFMGPRKTVIPLNKMNEIIRIAEIIYRDQKLNDLLLFLLESYTHMDSLEFSQSYLFSWFIVENWIPLLFAEVVSEKNETRVRKTKAEKYDNWSISSKIELLHFVGKIDEKQYEFLINYNKKRNHVVHKGKAISASESKKLFEFCLDTVKHEINQVLKEEGLKEI